MSECSWVLPQIRSMADRVLNDRGCVDGAAGAYIIHEECLVNGYLRSLGDRQEIVADEMVPSISKAIEGIGVDM